MCIRDSSAIVLDLVSGEIIAGQINESHLQRTHLKTSLFKSEDEEVSFLGNQVSLSMDQRYAQGEMIVEDQRHFVAVRVLPQMGAAIVVSQPRMMVANKQEAFASSTKRTAFTLLLIIGLASTCLSLSVLTQFGNKVSVVQQDLAKQVTLRTRELTRTRNAVIFGLAKLAESRDNDTGEHLDRIRIYVTILAEALEDRFEEIDESFIRDLSLASSLHDIGKVGIPDSILLKPGRLESNERSIMELHTLIGGECLDAIQSRLGQNDFLEMARRVAYSHHERWDGTGYPHGLAEEEIPLVARIVAVADVYDALTSKRPYKRAMSHMESKTIIVSGSGAQFDPEVVQAFLRNEDKFSAVAAAQQNLNDDQSTSKFQKLAQLVDEGNSISQQTN